MRTNPARRETCPISYPEAGYQSHPCKTLAPREYHFLPSARLLPREPLITKRGSRLCAPSFHLGHRIGFNPNEIAVAEGSQLSSCDHVSDEARAAMPIVG